MSTNDAIKIFWPSHLCSPKCQYGYLIGWYNVSNDICVASIVPNVELRELEQYLSEFRVSGEQFVHINKVCNVPPKILGYSTMKEQCEYSGTQEQKIWLNIQLTNNHMPILLSLYMNNEKFKVNEYQVIFYDQPNPKRLQFLALNPLELDISVYNTPRQTPEKHAALEHILHYSHQLNGSDRGSTSTDLEKVLIQINSSYFLEQGMQQLPFKHKHKQTSQSHILGCFVYYLHLFWVFPVRVIMSSLKWLSGYYIKKWITLCSMCFLFLILTLAEATLQALNLHLPPWILNGIAFKDLSAAGQQIDLRLQQLFFWSRHYVLLRKQNWANTAKARAHYISFYNSMWLVANDIIIGIALGSFLTANKYVLAERLHDILNKYTVKSLESMVSWFLESPAGLKLNQELAYFLSELFLWLLRLWTLCPQAIERFTPQIIHAIGLSGIFGVTMLISLSSDFLAFMTLHIYCFYTVAARIFNWQLVILYSLFNLFRGKKKNVLRNRIDSCDYDLDQLLLGTSLFTLLTFLFPTVFVYYLTFALGRVGIIILQAIMETVLAFFNHFPLFAIMLRIKDPHRLPGGLQFHIFSLDYFVQKQHTIFYKLWTSLTKKKHKPALRKTKKLPRKRATVTFNLQEFPKRSFESQRDSKRATYLWMRNLPISMSAIFFQYMLLWKRLSAHYFSAYVFKCLLYGEPIKPTPKLQYPMLPDTRPSLKALWQTFISSICEGKKSE
ncbi:hypothetical protein RMATCC62417_12972 [Rhizopus microsporus]|nr:hypothetical protein RMATCC62417_12972 [Rhizopus microsporus]